MNFFKKLFGFSKEHEEIKATESPKSTETISDINGTKETTNLSKVIDVKISSYTSNDYQEEELKPIVQDNEGYWILNPETPFILTVKTKDKELAQSIRNIVDFNNNDYNKDEKLVAIFVEHNIVIKEIEEYKNKYKKGYLNKIEELKKSSTDWPSLGEKDREDIMVDFRKIAINEIFERADCNLEVLFENEPKDASFDDDLIKEFGFKNIQVYIKYADKLDKVRVIANDNIIRPVFEALVELNLAVRGNDISKLDVLGSLSLKELNLIAQVSDKEFKRKNQAIEYITSLNDSEQRIAKHISMRELFQLKPLPEKYKTIDIKTISETWNYHFEEANLLLDTFRNSYYSWRNLKNNKYVKEYFVERYNLVNDCPCSKSLCDIKYSKNEPPKVPYHIGCNCNISSK